jgi:hypothetical protein
VQLSISSTSQTISVPRALLLSRVASLWSKVPPHHPETIDAPFLDSASTQLFLAWLHYAPTGTDDYLDWTIRDEVLLESYVRLGMLASKWDIPSLAATVLKALEHWTNTAMTARLGMDTMRGAFELARGDMLKWWVVRTVYVSLYENQQCEKQA